MSVLFKREKYVDFQKEWQDLGLLVLAGNNAVLPEGHTVYETLKVRNIDINTLRSAVGRNYREIHFAGDQTAASSLPLIFHRPIYEGTSF